MNHSKDAIICDIVQINFAIITPIIVELLQPIIGRSFDVDDVMMNFTGIIAGYFIAIGIKAIAAKLKS